MPEEKLHPVQVAAWKKMDSDEKWRLAVAATGMLREAARRRIARQNPTWSADRIDRETARFLTRART